MSHHTVTVIWQRGEHEVFSDNGYSRAHHWHFDGGAIVAASASPQLVPLPYSVAEHVDPEEAFIAALSSCHMLVFLGIAAKRRYVVESYHDHAIGVLAKRADGKTAVTEVRLRPQVVFCGEQQPSLAQLEKLHHLAHENCFIANSVTTQIITEIQLPAQLSPSATRQQHE